MNLTVLLGSVAAVLVLAGIAWLLKLGKPPRIESPEAAAQHAREAHSGFRPKEIALDTEGRAALVLGEDGAVVLLRPHGAQITARVFSTPPTATQVGTTLTIATGDYMFGDMTLTLDEAEANRWAARLETVDA